ncbi:MAG: hypothetical protein AB7F31_01395 [Parachlamydiales bacterium]
MNHTWQYSRPGPSWQGSVGLVTTAPTSQMTPYAERQSSSGRKRKLEIKGIRETIQQQQLPVPTHSSISNVPIIITSSISNEQHSAAAALYFNWLTALIVTAANQRFDIHPADQRFRDVLQLSDWVKDLAPPASPIIGTFWEEVEWRTKQNREGFPNPHSLATIRERYEEAKGKIEHGKYPWLTEFAEDRIKQLVYDEKIAEHRDPINLQSYGVTSYEYAWLSKLAYLDFPLFDSGNDERNRNGLVIQMKPHAYDIRKIEHSEALAGTALKRIPTTARQPVSAVIQDIEDWVALAKKRNSAIPSAYEGERRNIPGWVNVSWEKIACANQTRIAPRSRALQEVESPPPDWQVEYTARQFGMGGRGGYEGVVFSKIIDRRKHYVIAHRGTDTSSATELARDLLTDGMLVAHQLDVQFLLAHLFARAVRREIARDSDIMEVEDYEMRYRAYRERLQDYWVQKRNPLFGTRLPPPEKPEEPKKFKAWDITSTGHSLGGALSHYESAWFFTPLAVTFDNPGTQFIFSKVREFTKAPEGLGNDIPVRTVEYLSFPDIVNTFESRRSAKELAHRLTRPTTQSKEELPDKDRKPEEAPAGNWDSLQDWKRTLKSWAGWSAGKVTQAIGWLGDGAGFAEPNELIRFLARQSEKHINDRHAIDKFVWSLEPRHIKKLSGNGAGKLPKRIQQWPPNFAAYVTQERYKHEVTGGFTSGEQESEERSSMNDGHQDTWGFRWEPRLLPGRCGGRFIPQDQFRGGDGADEQVVQNFKKMNGLRQFEDDGHDPAAPYDITDYIDPYHFDELTRCLSGHLGEGEGQFLYEEYNLNPKVLAKVELTLDGKIMVRHHNTTPPIDIAFYLNMAMRTHPLHRSFFVENQWRKAL